MNIAKIKKREINSVIYINYLCNFASYILF